MTKTPKKVTGTGTLLGLVLVALVSCDSADVTSAPPLTEVDAEAAARLGLPNAVTDLRVISATNNTITVGWTAVSDGRSGGAKYALRAHTPPFSWRESYPTEIAIPAKRVGERITFTYTGAPPAQKAEFQLISYRGELNTSTVVFGARSNIAAGETLPADSVVQPEQPEEPVTPTTDSIVASVTAAPASHAFTAVGATAQITATAKNKAGTTLQDAKFVWSSRNSAVVTVDASGRMTARAAGNTGVIVKAANSAAADTVPVTVTIAPPPTGADTVAATVTASPSSHSFTAIGATGQITATAKNKAGTTLQNAKFVWSSRNTAVVTVDASGRITARGAGTAGVIVKSATSAAADTVPVTVTIAPPPTGGGNATYPNRPSGTTLIGRNDGTVKESGGRAFGIAGFGNWYDHNVASDIAVVNDPSNPTGSGRSLRFTYPSNDNKAGSATANSFSGGPYRELYVMTRVFMEPSGWDTFGNKFFYVGAAGRSSGGPTQYYTDRPGGARLRVINQYSGSAVVVNSADGAVPNPIQQGVWLNIEYHFVAETSPGAANGRMQIWVNNRLVASNNAVRWANNSQLGFNGMEWYAEVNSIPKTSYYRLGELYIAGRK